MSKKKWLAGIVLFLSGAYALYLTNWIPQYTAIVNLGIGTVQGWFGVNPVATTVTGITALSGVTGLIVHIKQGASNAISNAQKTVQDITGQAGEAVRIADNKATEWEQRCISTQEALKAETTAFKAYKTETIQFQTLSEQQKLQISTLTAERNALSRQLTTGMQTAKATVCLNDVMKQLDPSISPATISNALKAGGIEVILK